MIPAEVVVCLYWVSKAIPLQCLKPSKEDSQGGIGSEPCNSIALTHDQLSRACFSPSSCAKEHWLNIPIGRVRVGNSRKAGGAENEGCGYGSYL